MHPRKKKNAAYRKTIKSMIVARRNNDKCIPACAEIHKAFVAHNSCLFCPYLLTSLYHMSWTKGKTFKQIKAELREISILVGKWGEL